MWASAVAAEAESPAKGRRTDAEEMSRTLEGAIDFRLLARAIFQESNRVRRQRGFEACAWSEEAEEAAAMQAEACATTGVLTHDQQKRELATVLDRLIAVGLQPEEAAENLATGSVWDVGLAERFQVRREGGRAVAVDPASGRALPWHTYRSFAAVVVARWMRSEEHRANLLNPRMDAMGCAVADGVGIGGTRIAFCAQVLVRRMQLTTPAP